MGTAERRMEVMRILCRRRHETISNLAEEFGVSTRTILRDVEVLSFSEPIYTQCGRYGGGVYIMDDFVMNRMYMNKSELLVLNKVLSFAKNKSVCNLNNDECALLKTIISQYTKPINRKENKYESERKRVI